MPAVATSTAVIIAQLCSSHIYSAESVIGLRERASCRHRLGADMNATRGNRLLANLERALGRRGADRDGSMDLALEENMTWSTRVHGSPVEVSCLSGIVWVTREGDPEDHVLSEGATFVTSRRGLLAMMAFRHARVRVTRHRLAAGAVLPAPPMTCPARGRSRA